MTDRIESAAIAAVAGATLGAPFRGKPGFSRLSFYEPIPNRMTASPSLDAWVALARQRLDLQHPAQLGARYAQNWGYNTEETAFGRANWECGLVSPASGSFANPLGNGSEAIGRCVFWGLAFFGNPSEAYRWAAYDASFDHSGDGVFVPAALAAAIASAEPGVSVPTILKAVSAHVPPESRVQVAIKRVIQAIRTPDGVRTALEQVRHDCALIDPLDALLTLTAILAALGNAKDAPMAMCTAVGTGGASDHKGIATACLGSLIWAPLPEEWITALGSNFVAGHGLRGVDPPDTIANFVTSVREAYDFHHPIFPPAVVAGEPTEGPPPLPAPAPFPATSRTLVWRSGDLHIELEYLDEPFAIPNRSLRLAVRFVNSSPFALQVSTEIMLPQGWTHSTRMSSFQLEGGGTATHGIVLQTDSAEKATIGLTINERQFQIPFLMPQKLFFAGPFPNDDGNAYTKEAPPERNLSLAAPFAGRSGLSARWECLLTSGRSVNVEPMFKSGPGVVVLYSRFSFEKPGKYRIVAAGSPGVVVKIDGKQIVQYLDTHTPLPRAQDPYTATFEAGEETTMILRLIRDREPASTLTLYFLSETGEVVEPVTYHDLPE